LGDPPAGDTLPDRAPARFVWGVWALTVLAAGALVVRFGADVPINDDWYIVPALTGAQPVSLAWLWAQHNYHRILLPKLVLVGLLRLTGSDFRAGMFVNLAALAALSAALIRTARVRRGRSGYADAFLPFVLLHPGHAVNLLWSWQVGFVLSTALAGTLLILVVRKHPGVLAGACLVLLALCGPCGLALVPGLALWLLASAVRRPPTARRHDVGAVACAVAALALVGLYYADYQWPEVAPPNAGPRDTLRTAAQLLSQVLPSLPPSLGSVAAAAASALILVGLAFLLRAWRRAPAERLRTLGLLLFIAGQGILILGIAYGRAAYSDGGLEAHYVVLLTPVLLWLFFVSDLASRSWRQSAHAGLLILGALLFGVNVAPGLKAARYSADIRQRFLHDLASGQPPFVLAEHHLDLFLVSETELADYLRMLAKAKVGRFAQMTGDPAFVETKVLSHPDALREMVWHEGTGYGSGVDSWAGLSLERPRRVFAVRLIAAYPGAAETPPEFRLSWRRAGEEFFDPAGTAELRLPPGPQEMKITVWVNDTIDALRVQPDARPFVFRLWEVQLLEPP
jgi:hypothetical protein